MQRQEAEVSSRWWESGGGGGEVDISQGISSFMPCLYLTSSAGPQPPSILASGGSAGALWQVPAPFL